MPKLKLSFAIDFYPEWKGYEESNFIVNPNEKNLGYWSKKMDIEREGLKKIYNSLGLKLYSESWAEMELNEQNALNLLEKIKELEHQRIGHLGRGLIVEKLTPEETAKCDWFIIYPQHSDAFDDFEPYPTCKACQCPPNAHILSFNHVSQKFKEVVEKHNLIGLEFLWCKDIGRFQSQQWFRAFPIKPLGHGLDHEWFDRKKYVQHTIDSNSPLEEAFRKLRKNYLKPGYIKGETHFDGRYFKQSWSTGSRMFDELISKFPMHDAMGLMFHALLRYQRKHLPATDFAYIWDQPGASLCLNKKSKDILLSNRLINEKDIRGILLYDQIPQGVEDLDADPSFPPFDYYRKDWQPNLLSILKKEESKLLSGFEKIEKSKPIRHPDMKRSLKLLRMTKKDRPNDFKPGISMSKLDKTLQQLSFRLPNYWLEVLRISSGGNFGVGEVLDCEIALFSELEKYYREILKIRKDCDQDYNEKFIYFGKVSNGDFYAFEKDEQSNIQDSPILLISHEDFSIVRKWDGIADFLESIILDV